MEPLIVRYFLDKKLNNVEFRSLTGDSYEVIVDFIGVMLGYGKPVKFGWFHLFHSPDNGVQVCIGYDVPNRKSPVTVGFKFKDGMVDFYWGDGDWYFYYIEVAEFALFLSPFVYGKVDVPQRS